MTLCSIARLRGHWSTAPSRLLPDRYAHIGQPVLIPGDMASVRMWLWEPHWRWRRRLAQRVTAHMSAFSRSAARKTAGDIQESLRTRTSTRTGDAPALRPGKKLHLRIRTQFDVVAVVRWRGYRRSVSRAAGRH